MTQTPTIQIEQQRGRDDVAPLLAFLKSNKGSSVRIEMGDVETLSGRQLELVLTAWQEWSSESLDLKLVSIHPGFAARMASFGVPSQLLSEGI